MFTVPPGSAGMYYFSVFMQIDYGTKGTFTLRLNNGTQCTARGDTNDSGWSDTGITCTVSHDFIITGNKFLGHGNPRQSYYQLPLLRIPLYPLL